MNEPHDLDIPVWVESVQYVVNAVRGAGATNYLLLPGSNYTSAETFPTGAGPYLIQVTDPLGGTGKLIMDGVLSSMSENAVADSHLQFTNISTTTTAALMPSV